MTSCIEVIRFKFSHLPPPPNTQRPRQDKEQGQLQKKLLAKKNLRQRPLSVPPARCAAGTGRGTEDGGLVVVVVVEGVLFILFFIHSGVSSFV